MDNDAYRPVTVYPQHVHQVRFSATPKVIDWDFTQDHPLLWRYESSHKITCNTPLSLDRWMQISEAVTAKMKGYSRQANFVLTEQDIPHFAPGEPKPTELPVLFLIGGTDYIIADDFEVEVPEFIHKPEWFQPRDNAARMKE